MKSASVHAALLAAGAFQTEKEHLLVAFIPSCTRPMCNLGTAFKRPNHRTGLTQ